MTRERRPTQAADTLLFASIGDMTLRSLVRRILHGKPPVTQWERLEAEGVVSADRGTYGTHLLRIHDFRLPDGRWVGSTLTIGKYCSIAAGVQIFLGGNHRTEWVTQYPFASILDLPGRDQDGYSNGPIVIGHDVWIGTDAMLMSGITIGDGAVVAAGSVVTKDVPPYTIVGGNPAKTIRLRFDPQTVERVHQMRWWDWPDGEIRARLDDTLMGPPEVAAFQPPTTPGGAEIIDRELAT